MLKKVNKKFENSKNPFYICTRKKEQRSFEFFFNLPS